MLKFLAKKIFGSWHEKYIKKLSSVISKINALESRFKDMPDEDLYNMTEQFRLSLSEGASLDDLLPEAFAVVREVSRRVMNMRHYDVQLIGGYVLHKGQIAEMKTGEGKTLVATLALYLNALSGKGAHLVTVNDYLARRDATWMAPIYLKLGLSVGIIQHEKSLKAVFNDKGEVTTVEISRKEAYDCDITYGTNNEYGFDYLRDNMKYEPGEFAQRELNFAIVDEVDSILIDEARTPLIISGPTDETTDKYYIINNVVKNLKKDEHYTIDEKARTATMNDAGINYVEKDLKVGNLFDVTNVDTLHFVNNALKAHAIFKLDVDYMIQDGSVVIVDEFTGRPMPGRRFSDGLHQALEAKEMVKIQNENQTLASITFQNYFRMYAKLSGMTGTAFTEAEEFQQIYALTVVPIPTHMPLARIDHPDVIYRTSEEKYRAICNEIARLYEKGQPVLVGTISVEQSEFISRMLAKMKIKHEVLNAKNHEREALIVANAGLKNSVTIATNMAGRGTDIKLGEGVKELGGLYILGTERHESRRIDNQLRGRSGRQGDPGESRFFISMQDDLMRIFGAGRIGGLMDKLGMKEDTPLESGLVTKAIENAQKKVESMHFEVRKHLLEYDNVSNQQRNVIYGLRKSVLNGEVEEILKEFSGDVIDELIPVYSHDKAALYEEITKVFGSGLSDISELSANELSEAIKTFADVRINERKDELDSHFQGLGTFLMINVIDSRWKEHLLQMDYLRDSVGLRGYGQKDPLIEYKKESFNIFADMYNRIQREIVSIIMHVQIREKVSLEMKRKEDVKHIKEEKKDIFSEDGGSSEPQKQTPIRRDQPKVGRNDPCPCGSGKKYKNCHGAQ